MKEEKIKYYQEKTRGVFHILEYRRFWDYITNLQTIEQQYSAILSENAELENKITNLQEELEDLRESDWAWHQTLKAQNKREYRSKFLKEFQQEYNTNTFPDYDEIYKRYDKLKEERKTLYKYTPEKGFRLVGDEDDN